MLFQDKSYSIIAQAHNLTVLIYLATWKAAKLGILTHFISINLPRYSQSINFLMYLYYTDLKLPFMSTCHSCDHTSLHYRRPKKFLYYIFHWIVQLLMIFRSLLSSTIEQFSSLTFEKSDVSSAKILQVNHLCKLGIK